MRLYLGTADCLVDDVLLHCYVKAKNERQAWLKAYVHFNYHCDVADGGTVDVKRISANNIKKGVKIL